MTSLKLTTMMAALLAGSLALGAAAPAFARADDTDFDPAKFQQRIEKRVDRALDGTTATQDQKKQITGILQAAFADMKGLRDQRAEVRKALSEAMGAPTIDTARIEAIRAQQLKLVDDASRRFTKALVDAGNVLNADQRKAFFEKWNARFDGKRKG